ncbi:LacI family DNA-binding transcriptional regulator [Jiangella alkaliphila]|uniref:Transcriptional regulator, LacI family n=1 Tax=Jiangella alkaliphila TaxID=419479 RepID=A0A1H2LWU9_9ACTN|nr:LacI family DNA-binding transcriptional regulator [Jiangella alkaliphila]SDU85071.1 transcriptional regulator, LacI family [Jiangella alkaliphila]
MADTANDVGDRVTIADIARMARVSVPTVSKVINGKPGVSDRTRARITGLLREHEYEPRRSTSTKMIELVLGELTSPWSTALVTAVEEAAFDQGMGLTLSRLRPEAEDRWLEMLANRSVDGLVFAVVQVTARQRAHLEELRLPYVVIDPGEAPAGTRVPTIGVTHWRGAHQATRHLLELGHRELAMIAGPADVMFSQARVDGFRAAAVGAGVELPPARVRHTEFGYDAGRDAALELLAASPRPTAIFAASDEQALGVYEAARLRGVRIPEDLSVIGFNDAPIAEWAAPPLTTVREPIRDMARLAVAAIRSLAAGEPEVPTVELATELVIRQSTAPAQQV